MNVLVLGGYGVFGERLARLLTRDGHQVTVAGRDLRAAERLGRDINCSALQIDRTGDLSAIAGFDVVVDAAGPFHTAGDDAWRVARAAIAAGAHYLDLSDNAAFCAGVGALDGAARAAGVCVLSGLSSVPAISSAAARALAGADPARMIDTAILPGNRAPRGLSVMQSILAQAGRPMMVWRGRQWMQVRGWSDPAVYELPGGLRRRAWRIEVPDTRLFPQWSGADSVSFRAGMELGLLNNGLAAFAWMQRGLRLPVSPGLTRVFRRVADMLASQGTDRGGMLVAVIAGGERRVWALLAGEGEGPFIPAVPVRALLRRQTLPVGAQAAVGVLGLDEIEAAMADLAVRTERSATPRRPLFARGAIADFDHLPDEIRRTHDTVDCSRWQGRAQVTRGGTLWSRLIAAAFRFPPANADTPVTVTKLAVGRGETWVRTFGRRRFRSHLAVTPSGDAGVHPVMTERFGPFTFLLGLHVSDGALHFPVRGARMGLLPMPRWLLPRSKAREYVQDGHFCFDVALFAPLTGRLIVRYRGWLEPAPSGDASPSGSAGASAA